MAPASQCFTATNNSNHLTLNWSNQSLKAQVIVWYWCNLRQMQFYMSPIISVCKHTWRCFTSDNQSHLGGVHSSKTIFDNQWCSERYLQLLNTYSKTKSLLQCKINPQAAQRRYVYIVYLGLQWCLTVLTKSPQGSRITCVTPLWRRKQT